MRGGGAGLPSIFVIVWVLLFEIASQAQKRNKIYELAIFGRQKQNALLRFINSALPAFDFMHRRNCHSKFSLIRFKFFFFFHRSCWTRLACKIRRTKELHIFICNFKIIEVLIQELRVRAYIMRSYAMYNIFAETSFSIHIIMLL